MRGAARGLRRCRLEAGVASRSSRHHHECPARTEALRFVAVLYSLMAIEGLVLCRGLYQVHQRRFPLVEIGAEPRGTAVTTWQHVRVRGLFNISQPCQLTPEHCS